MGSARDGSGFAGLLVVDLHIADAASLMREFSFLPPPDKVGCTPSMGMSMSSPTPGPSGSQVPTSQEVVEAMLAGRHQ